MNDKWIRWILIAMILCGVLLIVYAAYTIDITTMIIGILIIVVSALLTFIQLTLQLFRMDKQLNLEALKRRV